MKKNKPKRCIKRKTDMLKKPSKATRFNYDTHDNTPLNKGGLRGVLCILQEGWLAIPEGYKVSLAGLFHHICLPNVKQFLQLAGLPKCCIKYDVPKAFGKKPLQSNEI